MKRPDQITGGAIVTMLIVALVAGCGSEADDAGPAPETAAVEEADPTLCPST